VDARCSKCKGPGPFGRYRNKRGEWRLKRRCVECCSKAVRCWRKLNNIHYGRKWDRKVWDNPRWVRMAKLKRAIRQTEVHLALLRQEYADLKAGKRMWRGRRFRFKYAYSKELEVMDRRIDPKIVQEFSRNKLIDLGILEGHD
jgi:hypothetical protein